MTTHVLQTLPFPWYGGCQFSQQLLIQLWICAPGTHYGWVDQGSVEYEVYPTPLHMTNTKNLPSDLLTFSLMSYPLGHVFHKEQESSKTVKLCGLKCTVFDRNKKKIHLCGSFIQSL